METQLLREKQILPTGEVLEDALGKSYPVFEEMMEIITSSPYGLEPQWNYYNDGKAWLCKVCFKKKTVFWLSVWDSYYKIGFYFTAKTGGAIAALPIDELIKKEFVKHKPIGKLLPLAMNITHKDQIKDLLTLIEYKKSLK